MSADERLVMLGTGYMWIESTHIIGWQFSKPKRFVSSMPVRISPQLRSCARSRLLPRT
jgi:hypothetical protein